MQWQGSFLQAEYAHKKKPTRRYKFLAEMEQVVPWARLVQRLQPFYPKGERGRPPIGLERMLRVYFVQQWCGLADAAVEDAFHDSQALRGFAGIDLNRDPVPDATTVLHFRHWLEKHDLTKGLFDEVGAMLEERGLLMRQGTIPALREDRCHHHRRPASTKNKEKARDPEMHQTKKGNQWNFRDQGAYRGGRRLRRGALAQRHRRQRGRHQPDGGATARPGAGGLRRCRLNRRGQAPRTR